jgi:hypothetical protein
MTHTMIFIDLPLHRVIEECGPHTSREDLFDEYVAAWERRFPSVDEDPSDRRDAGFYRHCFDSAWSKLTERKDAQ